MARDYAKGKQSTARAKAGARKKQSAGGRRAKGAKPRSVWRWYIAGLLTGFFMSFLLYLGSLPSPGTLKTESQEEPAIAAEPPKPRFDFYTLLPEQTIDAEVEPRQINKPTAAGNTPTQKYLLQAGSFRQRNDADRRRAELLLLGLEPSVEESNGTNGRWFRVYLGPFDTHSKMAKARALTANQDIDTLLLKRDSP